MYGASRRAGRGKVDALGALGRSVRRHDAYVNVAEEFYDSIFDIHVKGVLDAARRSLPPLPKGATIILNLSIFGVKGLPSKRVYSTTKAVVFWFERTLRNVPRGERIIKE